MAKQPPETQLLAIALLNIADDEGYFMADPHLVRGSCRPYDDSTRKTIAALSALKQIKYITITLTETSVPIGKINNFLKHQKIDRPSDSKIKLLLDSTKSSRNIADASKKALQSISDDSSPEQGTGNREQGTGNKDQGKGIVKGETRN